MDKVRQLAENNLLLVATTFVVLAVEFWKPDKNLKTLYSR
jgi:hypothetical protein